MRWVFFLDGYWGSTFNVGGLGKPFGPSVIYWNVGVRVCVEIRMQQARDARVAQTDPKLHASD
jgi:hypothetical protein